METVEALRQEIAQQEASLVSLRHRLKLAEAQAAEEQAKPSSPSAVLSEAWPWPLQEHEYERYGRQMIVPGFGLQAQLRLKQSKVLIVGAGGLGCPAAAYLAGAGVGTLGLVDGDVVELSNLHRQIAHSTDRVGLSKVRSAVAYLQQLNPRTKYETHETHLCPANAAVVIGQYDVVLDCSDNPATRYFVSDACVALGRPLVSASALQTAGQLLLLNSPPGEGPCYRCVFPRPPPPETVVGCGEGGILGPVVGVMGVLQALEAVKLIARGNVLAKHTENEDGLRRQQREQNKGQQQHTMLIFSAMGGDDQSPTFRSVRLKGRRDDCYACSPFSRIMLQGLQESPEYYTQFCGLANPVSLLADEHRISAADYAGLRASQPRHVLLDVREPEHFSLGSIPGAVNVPISRFHRSCGAGGVPDGVLPQSVESDAEVPIYVVCRVGNDSQVVAHRLRDAGLDYGGTRFVGDIQGGLRAWKQFVDPTMPFV